MAAYNDDVDGLRHILDVHVASKEKVLEKWNVASNKNVLEERCFLLPYF
ncbi:MAG: hypothetical protein LLF78_00525 [Synergistaceae bacterium]|nr:hypothetical protein [Synergistaceae bacterium]